MTRTPRRFLSFLLAPLVVVFLPFRLPMHSYIFFVRCVPVTLGITKIVAMLKYPDVNDDTLLLYLTHSVTST